MEAKIEYAKGWMYFGYALLVLSGFIFASAGLFYNNSITTINKIVEIPQTQLQQFKLLNELNVSYNDTMNFMVGYDNITNNLVNSSKSQLNSWLNLTKIALLFAFIGIILLVFGQLELHKLKKENF